METGIGTIKIADEVVAQIAAIAATEVDGVSAIAGRDAKEFLNKAMKSGTGKGTKAVIIDHEVELTLSLSMAYGYNIPATCEQVQKKVKEVVESMTGLSVTDVDVRIAGITMPEA